MNYVVTGTSRGIGLELVRQLAGRGDRVAACCRKPAEATKLQEICKAHKDAVTIVEMDVQDSQSIKVRFYVLPLRNLDLGRGSTSTAPS